MKYFLLLLSIALHLNAVEIEHNGKLRVDYTYSDEWLGTNAGRDSLGLGLWYHEMSFREESYKAKVAFGARKTSADLVSATHENETNYPEVVYAVLTYDKLVDSNFKIDAGLMLIDFGLKPKGFEGDFSLRNGMEYGLNNMYFAASNMRENALKLTYDRAEWSLSATVFDKDASGTINGVSDDQSNLFHNYHVAFKAHDLVLAGLYANLGYLSTPLEGKRKGALSLGFGLNAGLFDVSFEFQKADSALAGTVEDQKLFIFELMTTVYPDTFIYYNLANASELERKTQRMGFYYLVSDVSKLTFEYGIDDYLKKQESGLMAAWSYDY